MIESTVKKNRRLKINKVATELFKEKGLANTSMQEIAKVANIGRRTLYEYYKTKDDIIYAVRNETLNILYDVKIDVDKTLNGYKQFEHIIRELYSHWIENLDRHLFIIEFNLYYDRNELEEMEMPQEYQIFSLLQDSYQLGVDDKSIRYVDDIRENMILALNSLMGLIMRFALRKRYKYGDKYYTVEESVKIVDFIMSSIKGN